MTFKPPSGFTAIEAMLELEKTEWSFEDETKQTIQGDLLRLVPYFTGVDLSLSPWPTLPWGQKEFFPRTLYSVNDRWYHEDNGATGEPEFDNETDHLLLDTSGEPNWYRQSAADAASRRYFSDNADNQYGFVLETRLQVMDCPTGSLGHYMLIDDGTYRTKWHFQEDRLDAYYWDDTGLNWSDIPELSVPMDLKSSPRSFRLWSFGPTFLIFEDDGMTMGFEVPTGTSIAEELLLGSIDTGIDSTTEIDYLYQYHATGEDLPFDDPVTPIPEYATDVMTATSPGYEPRVVLGGWDSAVFDLEGADGGTTTVQPQYKTTTTTGEWTNHGSAVTLDSPPQQTISLASIPTLGDAADGVRFSFNQQSDDGSADPYRISQVTVFADETTGELKIYPTWGPEYGETVAIDVKQDEIGNIAFPVQSNWIPDANTKLLLHFDDLGTGVFTDGSGNGNHGIVPPSAGDWTLSRQSGWFGYSAHAVGGQGQVDLPISGDFSASSDITHSFFAKAYTQSDVTGELWSHYFGGRGYDISLNTDGNLRVFATSGASDVEHIHTGELLGTNSWVHAWVQLNPGTDTIRTRVGESDWEETSGVTFDWWSSITTAAPVMLRNYWGNVDEYCFQNDTRPDADFDTLQSRNVQRTVPDDWAVFSDGEAITGERVNWYYPTRAYVKMPAHAPGEVDLYVSNEGTIYRPDRAYRYVRAYKVDVSDELEAAQACTTKSPFRIGYNVADGDVNLAMISTPTLGVTSHMSKVALEHEEAANIASYQQGEFTLTQPDTGTNYSYLQSVDTQELLVSTKSVIRREFKQGRPLYFKYLLGRGRYYFYSQDASTVADLGLIRSNIRIENSHGQIVPLANYAWDIEVSRVDIFNKPLPSNTFSVVLYTETQGRPGDTLYVVYDSLDARKDWGRETAVREIINPVPLFGQTSVVAGDFEYSATLNDTGTYDLVISS